MIVNELIIQTMRLVGRNDCAELMSDTPDSETNRMMHTMLFCYNAVIDELARGYFPLKTSEEMESEVGQYRLENFSLTPLKILRVTSGEKQVEWRILFGYLGCAEKKITVEYEYVPAKASVESDFVYPDYYVSDTLVTYGMAAEYMLICGDIDGSAAWESKYRAEIDRLLSLQTVRGRIPPRRWL
ncbi:MAG: hypothetical protein ACI4L9_01285 [Candidatus Coproplasma sp.]